MTKVYTKNTWVDEVLATAAKYQVKDDSEDVVYVAADITLSTEVVTAGSPLSAARMNNIEGGIDALDTLIDALSTLVDIHGAAEKTTLVNADEMTLVDSASSFSRKKITWSNIKSTLLTWANAIYTTGPSSAVNGNLAAFNGTTGKLLKDSGVSSTGLVSGPASAVTSNLAAFDGTTGKLVKDSGVLSTGVVSGPASAVNGNLAKFDGTGGKLIKDGGIAPYAGNWTPTLTNNNNISSSTTHEGQYMRVGNVVQCVVAVDITPTASGSCTLYLTLPVDPSANFVDGDRGSGVGACYTVNLSGSLNPLPDDKKMRFRFISPDTAARTWRLSFMYQLD